MTGCEFNRPVYIPEEWVENPLQAEVNRLKVENERLSTMLKSLLDQMDCGDNSCLLGGRGKGGMRTNGGCRCLLFMLWNQRVEIEWWYREALAETEETP